VAAGSIDTKNKMRDKDLRSARACLSVRRFADHEHL
jgi:hypothetical protein